MIVYLESNFVLEIALSQEQVSATEVILEYAERNEIALAIPWFSLAEPFSTVTQRSRNRKKFISQLEGQLRDMRRSRTREDVRPIELAPALLARIDSDETDNLIRAAERVLNVATVLAVDATVFRQAMEYRTRFDFSPQDALVYASVVGHLTDNESPGPHYFVTKDRDDFRDLSIAEELHALDCELLMSFPEMALLLEQPLPD